MNCPKCGQLNQPTASFCIKCGSPLTASTIGAPILSSSTNFLDKIIDLFKGRLNRRNYLIGMVLITLISYFLTPRTFDGLYMAWVEPVIRLLVVSISVRRAYDLGWSRNILKLIIAWIVLDIILWMIIFALSDFGPSSIKTFISLLRSIVTLLPLIILSLILLFKQGQNGPNQYGDPPLPKIRFPQDLLEGNGIFNFNKPKTKI